MSIIGCPGGWRTGGNVADVEPEAGAVVLASMFWVGIGMGAIFPINVLMSCQRGGPLFAGQPYESFKEHVSLTMSAIYRLTCSLNLNVDVDVIALTEMGKEICYGFRYYNKGK